MRRVEDAPTFTELHQAIFDPADAGYIGHYCGNVRFELVANLSAFKTEAAYSAAFWACRFAYYALRIRSQRLFTAPVFANHSWSTIAAFKNRTVAASVVEPSIPRWHNPSERDVTPDDLAWVAANYRRFETLWHGSKGTFRTAVEAFVDHPFQTSPRMATATLWAGIEALFDVSNEIAYRLSTYIATYLEAHGDARLALYQQVKKDYGVRSKAVHGGKVGPADFLYQMDSARLLLSRLLIRICENGKIPTTGEIERSLFAQ